MRRRLGRRLLDAASFLVVGSTFFLLSAVGLIMFPRGIIPLGQHARISRSCLLGSQLCMAGRASQKQDISHVSVLKGLKSALLESTSTLKGVGPQTSASLSKLDINTVGDLLLHLPVGVIDRTKTCRIGDAQEGDIVTLILKVVEVVENASTFARGPQKVTCVDEHGDVVNLLYFYGNSRPAIFAWQNQKRLLAPGAMRVVSGKMRCNAKSGEWEVVQPDVVAPLDRLDSVLVVEPQYRLTHGLSMKRVKDAIQKALAHVTQLQEELQRPPFLDWINECKVLSSGEQPLLDILGALTAVHSPRSQDDLAPLAPARACLAYAELLANQLELASRRQAMTGPPTVSSISGSGNLVRSCMEILPYDLSSHQMEALQTIYEDMDSSERRMVRLLQGDVGSGKTIVAFLAMLSVVDVGAQACLLAPTEVLAGQHFRTFQKLSSAVSNKQPKIAYLTGSTPRKERLALLAELEAGKIDILVGTHAVLGADVTFMKLGLAVVDEEQRFGVQQRQQLTGKHGSPGPHVLYLSATPIPRTMCLAQFGDMDILQLKQLPGGHRKRIETVLVSMAQVSHVADRVKAFVDSAESPLKVFWVLPLVEGKEGVELGAAVDRHRDLSSLLGPERVGLLHGRMPAAEKNRTLSDFAGVDDRGMPGPMRVLVATSIIEVGIDVPGANICIIENAERFGLSQLHQIRGRIGRGESLSDRYHCVMLYGMGASADSIKRLEVIKVNDDGFDIAEQDLKLRGPGHLRGVQQTGFTSGMKVADFDAHAALMEAAHKLARSQPAHYSAEHEVELEVLHALFRSEVCSGEVKQAPRASSRKTATAENGNAPEVLMNQISPHPFAAVDLTSNRTSLVLVDVETTGLNHKEDRILQLACKVLGDGTSPLRTYMAYCDPQGVRLGSAATAVHGITAEVLKENGAQPFPVVWNGLREWLQKVQEREGTEGIVLLAHNARFDYNFIREETIRAGLGRFALGQAGVVCIVDTLKILRSRSIWQTSIQRDRPPRPSSFSLGSLHEYLVSKPIVSSHNALSDVLALEAVLSHIEPAGWKELASQPITQSLVPTSDKQLQELIKSSAQSSVSRRESR